MRRTAILLFTLMGLILAGCTSSGSSAAEPVEAYLQAIVDQDVDRISTLVCSDWADSALLEMDAFMGVQAELDNVSCSEVDVLDANASVTCSGSILATYNNEQQQFSLEGRQYQLIKEGSEWLVCGYQ